MSVGGSADAISDALGRAAGVVSASSQLVANVLGNVDRLVGGVLADAGAIAGATRPQASADDPPMPTASRGFAAREVFSGKSPDQDKPELDVARLLEAGGRALRMARAAGLARRSAPRFLRVVREGLWMHLQYRLHAIKTAGMTPEAARTAREALDLRAAERAYTLCVELRGGVLKLGQFLSSRVDLLPAAWVTSLSRLQDRVPAIPWESVRARIEEELGAPVETLFSSVDAEPIAAASLAQVHAATLEDGTRVVVKVQVPGVEQSVHADLEAFALLSRVLESTLPQMDLPTIVTELARAVRLELDYCVEADSAEELGRLEGGGDVVVPRVVRERSARRVLTMERLEGSRLGDGLAAMVERGDLSARDRVLGILLETFVAQVLRHGVFHADPHPGNFLVLEGPSGPRLGLLDFGCVARLEPARRRAYAGIVAAVVSRDHERTRALLEALGFVARDPEGEGVRAYAELLLEAFRGQGTFADGAIDPEAQLRRALELARDNPVVRVPHDFVLLGRVLATLGGLFLHHKPALSPLAIVLPHLAGVSA